MSRRTLIVLAAGVSTALAGCGAEGTVVSDANIVGTAETLHDADLDATDLSVTQAAATVTADCDSGAVTAEVVIERGGLARFADTAADGELMSAAELRSLLCRR